MKNLLIGNGVNQCTSKTMFDSSQIKDRFYKELKNYNYSEYEQELKFCFFDFLDNNKNNVNLNIEQIASNSYQYVKENLENDQLEFIGSNNDYRVKRILKKCALNAIFIKDGFFIDIKIDPDIVDTIMKFQNIYTLNYFEYWDRFHQVEFLHGNIKVFRNTNDIIDSSTCIFSPKLDEPKSISEAVFPSNNSFPANDLYPGDIIELYSELEELDKIVIFGVSPYGDKELMDKIKKINRKIIFVYGMNKDEIKKWRELVGESTFVDSNKFKNYEAIE